MAAFALLIPPALCAKDCNGNKKLTRFGGRKKAFLWKKKKQQKLSRDVNEVGLIIV